MGTRRRADRGQVEQRLLILVTLGLVANGAQEFGNAAAGVTVPVTFLSVIAYFMRGE